MVLSTFLLKQGVCIFLDDIGSTTYLLILVLLMLSAFFSASETAFSAANMIRLRTMAEDGNKRAALAIKVASQYDKLITEEGFSRIPVYSETVDHIIGVVHTRDILQAALLNKNFDIKKLMTEPMYVHRSMKIARLLSEFQRKKVHIAIVMDDYGGTLGIVTMEDVLEELVGEIYDERDEVVTEFTEVTPDTYEISGDMPVDDFLDEIDYHPADIEEDDYDTMNGLALSVLEHIPAVGETFQLGRLTFTVLEMEEQKIEKMRVILAPDSEKEAEKEKEKD